MEPSYKRIALAFVNAYLLKADSGFVLIDTGFPGQWPALEAGLKAAGCVPDNLKLVILTHGDTDHCGNAGILRKSFGTPIAVHQGDAEWIRTGVGPKREVRTLSGKIFFFMQSLFQRMNKRPVGREIFIPDVILTDGQDLAQYGLRARVIHLPGHSKGSIAVLTENGILFAGDLLNNRTRPDMSPIIENPGDYEESLAKIRTIAGRIKVVCPGHGDEFPGSAITGISP